LSQTLTQRVAPRNWISREKIIGRRSADDLLILLDLLEYAEPDNPPSPQHPAAGKPFMSPVRIADLDT
jgi:hypothetical protein